MLHQSTFNKDRLIDYIIRDFISFWFDCKSLIEKFSKTHFPCQFHSFNFGRGVVSSQHFLLAVSPNHHFKDDVKNTIQYAFQTLAMRASHVDWRRFFMYRIIPRVSEHLTRFRKIRREMASYEV